MFSLYVCMKIVYYTCIDVTFRYQGQGHLRVKRSSWKKIKLYQVYYIFTFLNILLHIAILIQYYTSLNSYTPGIYAAGYIVFYTPGIYAAGYIVFALTFVRSSVRMFVR